MRRSLRLSLTAVLAAVSLLATLPVLGGTPSPAKAATITPTAIKVAVVQSDITKNAAGADGASNISNAQIGYLARVEAVRKLLASENGLAVSVINDSALGSVSTLRGYDVVVLTRNIATIESQRLALRQFAAEGGGVVSLFSTSRYDYRYPYKAPYASRYGYYWPFNYWWGFSGSSYMSQSFEYGEVSELIGTKFCNDPLFSPNYHIVGASTHWIVQQTKKDLGVSSLTITDPQPAYNETVWPVRNAPIATILNYSGEYVGGHYDNGRIVGAVRGISNLPTQYGAATQMAAWAMPYYYGRVVSYGFGLYDMITTRNGTGGRTADRLLVNSVKWAAGKAGWGNIRKAPDVTLSAWYTRGKIWSTAGVVNNGSIQIRGQLKVEYFSPNGSRIGTAYIKDPKGMIPVSPGERYSDTSQVQPSISSPSGRYRLRVSYTYYDYFHGGNVSVYRDGYIDGFGTGMTWRGVGRLVTPSGTHAAPRGSGQLAGADRYDTSVAISRAGWPNGANANSHAVVLASGLNFNDALAAAPLAGELNAPTLLVSPKAGLPTSVKEELARLFVGTRADQTAELYVVSSLPSSLVSAASAAIGRPVHVTTLAGSNAYDTARKIAKSLASPSSTAFITSGSNFADALSIAPIAAKLHAPVLFVDSTLRPETADALQSLGITHAIILGGTGAVGTPVQSALSARLDPSTPRLAGATRYDTCLAIINYAKRNVRFSDSSLYVATGGNYPDALALASLAGSKSAPVLLVNGSDIANSSSDAGYLLGLRSVRPGVTFLGGSGAVSGYVRGQIGAALTP